MLRRRDSILSAFFSAALLVALGALLFSCAHRNEQTIASRDSLNEHLTEANRIMVVDEAKEIDAFINRHQFIMKTTGTGLRIQILQKGRGDRPEPHGQVAIACKEFLLDGTLVYSADSGKPLVIRLGEGFQPKGLEEGLLTMEKGTKARLVLPSHLAFGMLGDGDKIPRASPLYYELEVLTVQK